MRDFNGYDLASLEQMVENYNKRGMTGGEDFAALLRAREAKRTQRGEPDLFKSLALLKHQAKAQCFVSYGDLARASSVQWSNTVRARMSGPKNHLDRLLDLCRNQQLPLLTAICVNRENLQTGVLEEAALSGFVAGARRLGITVGNDLAFLRKCQEACFDWGREQPLSP